MKQSDISLNFKKIMDMLDDGVWEIDESGKTLFVNKKLCDLLGMTFEEMLVKKFTDLVKDPYLEVLKNERKIVTTLSKKNGLNISCQLRINNLENGSGKIVIINSLENDSTQLKNVFEKSLTGIAFFDINGNLIRTNQAYLEIFGIESEGSAKGINIFEDPNMPEHLKKKLKQGKSIEYEEDFDFDLVKAIHYFNSTKTGKIVAKYLITPLMTHNQVDGYVSQIEDKTQTKKINLFLIKKIEELEARFTKGPEMICVQNLEGIFLKVNPKWSTTFQYTYDEIIGKSFLEFVHTEDLKRAKELLSLCYNDESLVVDFLSRYRMKSGDYRWVEWKAYREGHYIYSFGRDVTDKKEVEFKLQESEVRWKYALESAGDGVWEWDMVENKFIVSSQYKMILGFEENEIEGSFKDFEDRVHPDDKANYLKEFDKQLDSFQKSYRCEYRILSKSGQYKWLLGRGKVLSFRDDGRPLRMIGTIVDITKQKNIEEDLVNNQKMLLHTSRLASIGTLSAGIAHEINNPLAIVKGNITVLKDMVLASEKGASFDKERVLSILEKQDNASNRMTAIISSLKNYARNDGDSIENEDVNKIIKDVLVFSEAIYKNSNIEIETQFDEENLYVNVNKWRIQQVIINILNNSRDAIKEKNIEGKIIIHTYSFDGKVYIKFTDNGMGIKDINLQKIFSPFWTTKPVGKGTGLGLSISQSIMNSFGGSMHMESIYGGGTTTLLDLPLASKVVMKEKTQKRIPRNFIKGTALIIDDEDDIRELLRYYLEQFGLDVDDANNGIDALEKIKLRAYNYIITDLKMPKLSGDRLIEEIKKAEISSSKILIVTGGLTSDFSDAQLESLKKHAHGLITKPFTKENIYNALMSLSFEGGKEDLLKEIS